MKQLKKWAAVLLAFLLVVTLVPSSALADPGTTTWTEPTGKIIVKGVEKDAKVNAYRLTEAKYSNGSFTKYVNVGAGNFNNTNKPVNTEWEELLKKSVGELGDQLKLTWNEKTNAFEREGLGAGLYMILVTPSDGHVYNPLLVGLSYKSEGEGSVPNSEITVPTEFKITKKDTNKEIVLYMKKSEITLTKTTEDPSEEPQSTVNGQPGQSDKGNGLGLGEKPKFKIVTTIPSYATTDQNLVFRIEDTLDAGLTPPEDLSTIKVKVGKNDVSPSNDTFTVSVDPTNKHKIIINFAESYLKSLGTETTPANRKVEITYSATLNAEATANFKANENNVSLTYTNDPKVKDGKKTITDKTYHYTFDIDGLLNGEGSETSHEITKHHDKTETTTWKDLPLEGAKFGLFDKDPSDQTAKMLQDVTTDKTGRMNFKKLDEGVYYIKEIQAPNDYSLNEKVYKVEITADYNTNGTLKSYSIIIDDTATTTFKAVDKAEDTKDGTQDGVVTEKDGATLIDNTKIPGLPSTGGMGTYLFTGIGVALLAGAAVMVTVLRKKNGQTTR